MTPSDKGASMSDRRFVVILIVLAVAIMILGNWYIRTHPFGGGSSVLGPTEIHQ